MKVSHRIILEWKCLRLGCRGNQNTHFSSVNFFFSKNHAVYELM